MNEWGLYEIYDFWHVPFWETRWFKVVGASVLFLLLLGLVYFVWRVWRARVKRRTHWEVALDRLSVLRGRSLDDAEICRDVYEKLTRFLKDYCVSRYGWEVGGLTDKEFIIFLTNKQVDVRMQEAFKHIADGGERIKFARATINRERVIADCVLSEDFIRATIPSEQR